MGMQVKRSRALIRLCDMLYGEGKMMEPDNVMEKACNFIQDLLNKIDALQKEKAKMLDIRGKPILGVSDKSFDAASLQKILTVPIPDDITEAVTVLSRLIYDPASEIDPDLRMESYRVLHKHKMLQPLAFTQPQPKARE